MRNRPDQDASNDVTESFAGPWTLLFPATYSAHIAEEYWGGFAERVSETTGIAVSGLAFLGANALFLAAMCAIPIYAAGRRSRSYLIVALATVVTINTLLHIGGTLFMARYSAGLVTGVVLWLPLGVGVLARAHRMLPGESLRLGIITGIGMHITIPIIWLILSLATVGWPIS